MAEGSYIPPPNLKRTIRNVISSMNPIRCMEEADARADALFQWSRENEPGRRFDSNINAQFEHNSQPEQKNEVQVEIPLSYERLLDPKTKKCSN
jgi:hypothetical protein